MFYHNKNKTYRGRRLVKVIEASLLLGILLFGLDALGSLFIADNAAVNNDAMVSDSSTYEIHAWPCAEDVYAAPTYTAEQYWDMAMDHHADGEYLEAVSDYNRVLDAYPTFGIGYLNRGVAYESANLDTSAMADFNRYLSRVDAYYRIQYVDHSQISHDMTLEMREGLVYEIPFLAAAGQIIDIRVESASNVVVDPIFTLVDSRGQVIAANDDIRRQDGSLISMNSRLDNFEFAANGQYTLRVSHAGGGSNGLVTVTMESTR